MILTCTIRFRLLSTTEIVGKDVKFYICEVYMYIFLGGNF